MQHVICYSGGESSALTSIEVVRRFGCSDVVLLNHDICARVEHADIKRFKAEVAEYLALPITYANMPGCETKDQFDVCVEEQAFKVGDGQSAPICSSRLKTRPFDAYLEQRHADKDCIVYYGFDADEMTRIVRRSSVLALRGYRTDFPLALWERTIHSTNEIGVRPPCTYSQFKHANCIGCLKAGWQHWYVVYCVRPDIWAKGKEAEAQIGYTIHSDVSLEEMEPKFAKMKCIGIVPTEHISSQRFWADVERLTGERAEPDLFSKPCECVL